MEINGRREGIRAVTHAGDAQMTIRAVQTATCAGRWRTENGKRKPAPNQKLAVLAWQTVFS